MGSITGAFLAALIIAEVKALCIGIGVVNFRRVYGEFLQAHAGGGISGDGRGADRAALWPARPRRGAACAIRPRSRTRCGPARLPLKRRWQQCRSCASLLPLASKLSPYSVVLAVDVLIAILFATSLHFIMGPGGMHSFGHAAYFGLGAYGAGLMVKFLAAPMPVALLAARRCGAGGRAAVRLVRGAALRRLSGDADARLRADRLVDPVPVGRRHRRLQRNSGHLAAERRSTLAAAYLSAHACAGGRRSAGRCVGSCSRRSAMRCARVAIRRCARKRSASTSSACIGSAFAIAGTFGGLAGGLFAFAKGTISPDVAWVSPLHRRHGDGAARRHPDA